MNAPESRGVTPYKMQIQVQHSPELEQIAKSQHTQQLINSAYISRTHETEIAQDGEGIRGASSVAQNHLSKFLDDGLESITKLFQESFRDSCGDIERIINSHPFYVMYEPRLGCNSNQDASVSRSVYPIFKSDLTDIMSSLECKVTRQIVPIINQLIYQREEVLNKTFNQNQQLTINVSEEASSLRKQVQYLQVALLDQRKFKNEQIEALKREVQMLREQLTQKSKIGTLYKPDFIDKTQQEDGVVSQKVLKEQLLEQQMKFEDEKKALEKKYQNQINQLMQQITDLKLEIEQLKTEIERLQAIIDQKTRDFEGIQDTIGQKYQQEIDDLNRQLDSMMKKYQAMQAEYEKQLKEKDDQIQDLDEKLKKLYALMQTNEDALNKLKDELLKEQENNKQLLLTNQQLQELQSKTPQMADQIKQLNDELALMRDRYETANKKLLEVENLKKLLEDELARLKAEVDQKGGSLDPETEQLLRDAKGEFDAIKEMTKKTIQSMFNKENGTLVRLMQDQLYNTSPYDILKKDVGPTLWAYTTKYFQPEFDMIQQFCSNYANNSFRTKNRPTTKSGTAQSLKEVNAVLLDDVQTTTSRVPSASKKNAQEIGINTSLCGSLENQKLDGDFAVNQNLKLTEDQLEQYDNVKLHGSSSRSRPQSGAGYVGAAVGPSGIYGTAGGEQPKVRCSSCNQSANLTQVSLFGENNELLASVRTTGQCPTCGDQPGAQMACPECGREARVGGASISGAGEEPDQGASRAEDSAVEYLYREEQLYINDLDRMAGRPASGLAGARLPGAPADDSHAGAHPGQAAPSLSYTCPYCHKQNIIGHVHLGTDSGTGTTQSQNYGTLIYSQEKYNVPMYKFGFKPTASTVPDTCGVFDRLFARARQIELKKKRKRDLILQERMRTTERVLRALSLFVDNKHQMSKSAYQIQSGQRIVSMRQERYDISTPSTRHGSARSAEHTYIQAVMQVPQATTVGTPYRPSSATTTVRQGTPVAEFRRARPSSGRQQSVIQLLATSNAFNKNKR